MRGFDGWVGTKTHTHQRAEADRNSDNIWADKGGPPKMQRQPICTTDPQEYAEESTSKG